MKRTAVAAVCLALAVHAALTAAEKKPAGGKAAPRYDVTIQVQTLDASGVAGLDWDRLVQRHLVPALRQEADRRW